MTEGCFVDLLVAHVESMLDPTLIEPVGPVYRHMGALIVDSSLQAGLRYETVVAPRVRRVLETWPLASETSRFLDCCLRWGLMEVLNWTHPEKLERVLRITMLLHHRRVETVDELGGWALTSHGRNDLLALRGVGPKTVDYMAGLAGRPTIAVDRHLFRFAADAGLPALTYDNLAAAFYAAAEALELDPGGLDRAVWAHMADA